MKKNKKQCKHEFAICTSACMSEDGAKLLEKFRDYIGMYVCFKCGFTQKKKPRTYDFITGETVLTRLVKLGIIKKD